MLQQTQVARVVPRWTEWLERWPTVEALAAAPRSEVIRAWDGLGYNRRAVNLHRAAIHISERGWPDDLTELPGVGRYTADAVASLAFGRPVLPIDVNVRRVLERSGLELDHECGPALMGLGATVCIARVPRCDACPLAPRLPVPRPEVRACTPARAVRGLLPPASRTHAAAGRGAGTPEVGARRRGRRGSRRRRPRRAAGRAGSPAYNTGQLTTMGMALIDTWPAAAARLTATAERSTRAVCPSSHVTSRTAHSGV